MSKSDGESSAAASGTGAREDHPAQADPARAATSPSAQYDYLYQLGKMRKRGDAERRRVAGGITQAEYDAVRRGMDANRQRAESERRGRRENLHEIRLMIFGNKPSGKIIQKINEFREDLGYLVESSHITFGTEILLRATLGNNLTVVKYLTENLAVQIGIDTNSIATIFRDLIDYGVDRDKSKNNKLKEIFKALVNSLGEEDVRKLFTLKDPISGKSLLAKAVSKGDENLTALIAGKMKALGMDIDATDQYGNSPLNIAAEKGNLQCAKLLIESGASCYSKGPEGLNSLDKAIRNDHYQFVEWMLSLHDVKDSYDMKHGALLRALATGKTEMTDLLKKNGAKFPLDKASLDGAIKRKDFRIVDLFVAAGYKIIPDKEVKIKVYHELLDDKSEKQAIQSLAISLINLGVRNIKFSVAEDVTEAVTAGSYRNYTRVEEYSILKFAIKCNDEKLARFLLDRGFIDEMGDEKISDLLRTMPNKTRFNDPHDLQYISILNLIIGHCAERCGGDIERLEKILKDSGLLDRILPKKEEEGEEVTVDKDDQPLIYYFIGSRDPEAVYNLDLLSRIDPKIDEAIKGLTDLHPKHVGHSMYDYLSKKVVAFEASDQIDLPRRVMKYLAEEGDFTGGLLEKLKIPLKSRKDYAYAELAVGVAEEVVKGLRVNFVDYASALGTAINVAGIIFDLEEKVKLAEERMVQFFEDEDRSKRIKKDVTAKIKSNKYLQYDLGAIKDQLLEEATQVINPENDLDFSVPESLFEEGGYKKMIHSELEKFGFGSLESYLEKLTDRHLNSTAKKIEGLFEVRASKFFSGVAGTVAGAARGVWRRRGDAEIGARADVWARMTPVYEDEVAAVGAAAAADVRGAKAPVYEDEAAAVAAAHAGWDFSGVDDVEPGSAKEMEGFAGLPRPKGLTMTGVDDVEAGAATAAPTAAKRAAVNPYEGDSDDGLLALEPVEEAAERVESILDHPYFTNPVPDWTSKYAVDFDPAGIAAGLAAEEKRNPRVTDDLVDLTGDGSETAVVKVVPTAVHQYEDDFAELDFSPFVVKDGENAGAETVASAKDGGEFELPPIAPGQDDVAAADAKRVAWQVPDAPGGSVAPAAGTRRAAAKQGPVQSL